MGFLDKINYSMIVNSVNKSAREDTVKYFSRMSRKLAHSINMCFTVSGHIEGYISVLCNGKSVLDVELG